MKENILKKIYCHPERDEIISKLALEISPDEINGWLTEKYAIVGDKKLIISSKTLRQFKEEYLDLYKQMQSDFASIRQEQASIVQDMQRAVQNNSAYRRKAEEYLDKEIDLKSVIKNMIVAVEFRISQIYDQIQENPGNFKPDYVLIQWMQTLANILEKQEAIINGSPDKIMQQNNINIQILDKHINVFSKVINDVISKLDYDTSLMFVGLLNEELHKLRPPVDEVVPVDIRMSEAKKLESQLGQLDIPSSNP